MRRSWSCSSVLVLLSGEAEESDNWRGSSGEVMNRESEQRGEGRAVRVSAGPVELEGNLGVPQGARGVVLFAHGSAAAGTVPATATSPGCFAKLAWLRSGRPHSPPRRKRWTSARATCASTSACWPRG